MPQTQATALWLSRRSPFRHSRSRRRIGLIQVRDDDRVRNQVRKGRACALTKNRHERFFVRLQRKKQFHFLFDERALGAVRAADQQELTRLRDPRTHDGVKGIPELEIVDVRTDLKPSWPDH